MSRKDIQRERMWHYFINAAADLIENVGIEHITARKVAERAGFTTSTIYNYFQELSHVIFFASMRYTKPYLEQLPLYMDQGRNTLEKWLYGWECFCKESFKHPQIYASIFINHLGSVPENLLNHYYNIYRNDLVRLPEHLQSIILEHTLSIRSSLYVQQAVDEGMLNQEDVSYISEVTLLIWKGMMTNVLNQRRRYSSPEAMQQTLHLIHKSVMTVVPAEKQKDVNLVFHFDHRYSKPLFDESH
ncbi:TetR/AcrR family transcriptional regulator [Natribacillus halophilus]|uniref:Regulatory protein, tetR family n=1 Tax=Natribacillus halophilus TaxID=549003 RepID=A0A1G8SH25_9BACI|nr:TetR/AcrR family transcriptional regulator [Natribacillus halophilus]SDJ28453.1 regulatory protein, tetR family [Natribacillus halophilus]